MHPQLPPSDRRHHRNRVPIALSTSTPCSHFLAVIFSYTMTLGCGNGNDNIDAAPIDSPTIDASVDVPIDASTPDAPVDAAPAIDSMIPECQGAPLPPVEASDSTLTGLINTRGLLGPTPIANVAVSTYLRSDPTISVANDISAADGSFSVTVANNGMPLDAYMHFVEDSYQDSYFFPSTLIWQQTINGIGVQMLDLFTINLVASQLGVMQEVGNGLLVLVVVDCTGTPIEGATVSTVPATNDIFFTVNGVPNSVPTTTGPDGLALIFNAPSGAIEVDAEYNSISFLEHSVESFAGSMTHTVIVP